eukprot:8135337-Pyramimonas_sp.AAC.1
MEWKGDSLEMMVCGTQYTDTVTVQIGSRTVPLKNVDSLSVLGYQTPELLLLPARMCRGASSRPEGRSLR